MILTKAKAVLGLDALVTPTSVRSSGSIKIGFPSQTIQFPAANVVYSVMAVIAKAGASCVLDTASGLFTTATPFIVGAAQVKTATAVGTVSAPGNASVEVTAFGMTGSPKTFAVAVANGDTAAVWAGKVRTVLAADAAVAAMFTVSGTGTAIVLTRKPKASYEVPDGTLNLYVANDSSLNIILSTGTASGITAAPTAVSTTAGVESAGVKTYDGSFDGVVIGLDTGLSAMMVEHYSTALGRMVDDATPAGDFQLAPMEQFLRVAPANLVNGIDHTFTSEDSARITVTVIGTSTEDP